MHRIYMCMSGFRIVIPQTNKVKLRGSAKINLAMRLGSGEAKRAAWGESAKMLPGAALLLAGE